jgi:ribosome biogenesis GTPase / thiamine phosphate phosphatase
MLLLVPVIHPRKDALGLMDREDRAVGNHDELLVGYHGRNFNDGIGIGLQTGHFQIDPDQVVTARHYACAIAIDWLRTSLPEATLSQPGKPLQVPRRQIIWSDRPLVTTDTFDALVIATFGRHLLVRDVAGRELKARPFGRGLVIVAGDNVLCRVDARTGETHALELRARRNALYRSNLRGGAEPVVANLSQLLVVLAPRPEPDLFVLDRYLAAATSGGISATLVLNKMELGIDGELQKELDVYQTIGYDWLACSTRTGMGMDDLLAACAEQTSALVGQSGVGKSSLIRRLVPQADIEVGELVREEEGRHTTTASHLFDLPGGGSLIDSPGVRDFAPAIDRLDSTHLGFIEAARLAPNCRFADCRHMREPGCAVIAGVEAGTVHPRRYESYRRLRRLFEELTEARGPQKRSPEKRR